MMDNLLISAFSWYFFERPRSIIMVWKTILLFNLNYFSVPILIKTYFSPWRKYRSSYSGTFEFGKNIESFVFNSMSRIIGAILRTFFILLGIITGLLILLLGLVLVVLWFLSPVLIIAIFIFGIKLLIG